MSRRYKIRDCSQISFVTFTIVDWVDVFTRQVYKQMLVDSLTYCQQNKGLLVHAFCIMSNHVHLLLSTEGESHLTDIIRDFKKYTSKKIISLIETENESRRDWLIYRFQFHAKFNIRNKEYKVWQDGYHAIECDKPVILIQKLEYIHNNPVRAGIVREAEHYVYSSASNYASQPGIMEVDVLDASYFFSLV